MTKIMRKMKQCTALILAFAMVMTGGSFQGISFESKAATVSYTLAENMTGTVTANEEYEGVYSGTLAFTIPSEYNTKEKWDAAGINSFEVVFAVSSYQGVTGGATKVPGAQTLAMSDAWTWNSGSYANLTTEGTMTSIMDCAKMDWGGSNTLGKIGVQFTNLVGGSEVSYTIISAKLTGTGEPSTGSGP